ncbi:MAG: PAS domain-containing sensor histidine kinase [Pseudomonadota bacterium]
MTGKRQTGEPLQELARRLNEAQRVAQIGSWELDLITDTLVWSDEIYRIFEIDPEKFGATYQAFLDGVHPDDREIVHKGYQASLASKTSYEIIHRLMMADGRIKWVQERCETEYDGEGRPLRSLGTVQDITARKNTEDALHESQATLAALLKASPEAIIVTDDRGVIREFSAGAEVIFGYRAEEVIGSLVERLTPARQAHARHVPVFGASSGTRLTMNEQGEILGLRKNGEEFPVEVSLSKLAGAKGAIFAVHLRDVSRQNAAREELIRSKIAAERANETKSRFLANMSHELRTPLNAIIGFSEMLLNQAALRLDTAKCQEYAQDICDSGKHLLNIINDILDISRLDMGGVQPDEEPVEIADVIHSTQRMIRVRAANAGVVLKEEIASDLPILSVDRRLLLQATLNLVSNAIKFTPQGGAVSIGARRTGGGGVNLFVNDTGMGMQQADIARIGQPFMQVDMGHARRFEGTGLGLSIVKRIAEIHQGQLIVESAPGRGTTATIHLPASRALSVQQNDADVKKGGPDMDDPYPPPE